jgi:hypothetical protein
MSAKHIRTTADLVRFGAALRIDCRFCSAARTMSGTEVCRALGTCGFDAAEARLRCGRCGGKGAKVTVLPPV